MNQHDFFSNAQWVSATKRGIDTFAVLRGHFFVKDIKRVTLNALGLGFFKCYINGKCINPDTFLPLSSDYEAVGEPRGEVLSAHRVYVPEFDITPFVKKGDNVIALHFGGGWYTHSFRVFGLPKAIYRITVEGDEAVQYFVSDENCRIGKGYVDGYDFAKYEKQNYLEAADCFEAEFDDSAWEAAVAVEPLETEYCTTDCPSDKLIECIDVKPVSRSEKGIVYDCGKNLSGYPVLKIFAKAGDTVTVLFSEELLLDGSLDTTHAHEQSFTVVSNGKECTVQPQFTWFGFRFFEVIGEAEPSFVKLVHADIPIRSSFKCDNETINWIYDTFVHTMLCNMHTGHPSDCPHIERRGYTGDGQLTCHAVLSTLDAKAFYEKWLQDIADGQDSLSGHIQYTAPYILSGGGPGGWGCAIAVVPYQLYRHYGEKAILAKYYGNMRHYIDYLDAHTEFGLVTSDQEGVWCLGDWCAPNILYADKDITYSDQQVFIPAAMVNTYFYIKTLEIMCKAARVIGKEQDIPEYEQKINERKNAVRAAYFNAFDGNFIMNAQGANAYAVDLGLGNEMTYKNLVSYYEKTGCFDTGIFATDILTRVLFDKGDAALAVKLLKGDGAHGFEHWRKNGATTFHEYWDSNRSRSHNHPMFGAVVAYFFERLLGIKQPKDSAGYSSLIIEPEAVSEFSQMSGSMQIAAGKVSVSYEKTENNISFSIVIPNGVSALFRYNDKEIPLACGENSFTI